MAEKAKKNTWFYNNSICSVVEGPDKDRDLIIRFKQIRDTATNKVTLKVMLEKEEAEDKNSIAEIEISLLDLSKGLANLREYGLILQEYEIIAIKNLIETNFYDKKFEYGEVSSDIYIGTAFDDIMKVVADYIITNKLELVSINNINEKVYLIEVDKFKSIFADSEFKHINVIELRQKLAGKYTHCNSGRTSLLVRVKEQEVNDKESSKVIRYVAFYADKIKSYLYLVEKEAVDIVELGE